MIIIRHNTFETNSSSTHSITLCTKEEFEKWKTGELVYDISKDELIPADDKLPEQEWWYDNQYLTRDEFFDYYGDDYECYVETIKTPMGEEITAFGYYGYNG